MIEDLQLASYRGAIFFVTTSDTSGGRKTQKLTFVNNDQQLIQDFGLQRRSFRLDAVIAERRDSSGALIASYKQMREALLFALEQPGPAILIHPFYGRLENIVAVSWSINESTNRVGEASVSINFEVSDTDGVPIQSTTVISQVDSGNDSVIEAVGENIEDNYGVLTNILGNFEDALDKVQEVVDEIEASTSLIQRSADKIDAFQDKIANISADAANLVTAPVDLKDEILGTFDLINGLYTTFDGTFIVLKSLFDFGDGDAELKLDTVSRQNRQRNRDIINNSIQTLALSYSYLNASQIEFETVSEIENAADVLEEQYQKVIQFDNMSSDMLESLAQLRVIVQSFFDKQKVTARDVVTVSTNPTSIRLLAFQYYGSSELGEDIGELNGYLDGSLIQGDVEILTE